MTHYRTLGVDKRATMVEIRHAWRHLAWRAHPDHGGDKDAFIAIAEAYRVLRDSAARKRYDRYLEQTNTKCPICFGVGGKWRQVTLAKRTKVRCPRCDGTGYI